MQTREVIAWQIVDPEVIRSGHIQPTITDKPRVAQIWKDAGIKLRELIAKDEVAA